MIVYQFINDISPDQGGPAYSVPALTNNLATEHVYCKLFSSHDGSLQNSSVFNLWERNSFFSCVKGIKTVTKFSLEYKDSILHSHNLWTYTSLIPSISSKLRGCKHIISPRGSLTSYSMSVGSRLKPSYWKIIERHVLKSCYAFHATSYEEYLDIRRLGFSQPVAVIPNGTDLPPVAITKKRRQILFLGRLHYEKDVISLIEAWSNICNKFNDFELIIAGGGDDFYVQQIHNLIDKHSNNRISLIGPVSGEVKLKLLRESWVLVLPSPTENFGMVVAEALASSTIAIANKGSPWSALESKECGFWVENGPKYLEEALIEALSLDERTLQEMGTNGRKYVEQNFSWPIVSSKMKEFYTWISFGGDSPSFVRHD